MISEEKIIKNKKYNKKKLLEFGFNEKLISELLPLPELVRNPFYKCASPMQLWLGKDIINPKKTKKFKENLEKKITRKEIYDRAILTKKEKLMKEIDEKINQIEVETIDKEELITLTLDNQNNYYNLMNIDYYASRYDIHLPRWMINFIRHNLTSYDEVLFEIRGRTGIKEAYLKYKKAVLIKIAISYPYLKEDIEKEYKVQL